MRDAVHCLVNGSVVAVQRDSTHMLTPCFPTPAYPSPAGHIDWHLAAGLALVFAYV